MIDTQTFLAQTRIFAGMKARGSTRLADEAFGQVLARLGLTGAFQGHVGVFDIGRNLDARIIHQGIDGKAYNQRTAKHQGCQERIGRRIAQPRFFKAVLVLFLQSNKRSVSSCFAWMDKYAHMNQPY